MLGQYFAECLVCMIDYILNLVFEKGEQDHDIIYEYLIVAVLILKLTQMKICYMPINTLCGYRRKNTNSAKFTKVCYASEG